MDFKKFAPWNWFKKEEEQKGMTIPVRQSATQTGFPAESGRHPLLQLHREMDRLFEDMFKDFGMRPFDPGLTKLASTGPLKPNVDIGASDKEYSITVEIPGVEEKDIRIEVADNTLTIQGEKKLEKEDKGKDYYRMERSYGSFQRVLSLPEDADQDKIKAGFRKGILTLTIPRHAVAEKDTKKIEIKSED